MRARPLGLLEDHRAPAVQLPRFCVGALERHMGEVWFVAVSHSRRYIATSSKDKTVIVWDSHGGLGEAHSKDGNRSVNANSGGGRQQ